MSRTSNEPNFPAFAACANASSMSRAETPSRSKLTIIRAASSMLARVAVVNLPSSRACSAALPASIPLAISIETPAAMSRAVWLVSRAMVRRLSPSTRSCSRESSPMIAMSLMASPNPAAWDTEATTGAPTAAAVA